MKRDAFLWHGCLFMKRRTKIISVNNITDFLSDFLLPNGKLKGLLNRFVFRGEATKGFALLPSILREYPNNVSIKWLNSSLYNLEHPTGSQIELASLELILLRKFYQLSNEKGLVLPPCDILQCDELTAMRSLVRFKYWYPQECDTRDYIALKTVAALAQHYGLPTRFLDWTHDIRIALYFASSMYSRPQSQVSNVIEDDAMVIWAIDKLFFDNCSSIVALPIKFLTPLYYMNPNICSQNGTLSYCDEELKPCDSVQRIPLDDIIENMSLDSHPLKDNCDKPLLWKFEIPVSQRESLLEYLKQIGVNASSVFKGDYFKSVAAAIKEEAFQSNTKKDER